MNKITFITATLTSGGAERVISLLANYLSGRDYQVEIICISKPIVFYSFSENVKITFAEREASNKLLPFKMLWLRYYIKRTSPDVVIAFLERVYCVTLLSLWGVSVPIISSERNDPQFTPLLKKILRYLLLWRTTVLVVQTEKIKQYYSKSIQKRTKIIPNPISDSIFNISVSQKKKRIISVGRLFPQKNHKMLIDAFHKVSTRFPDYNLVIYGEGPLCSKLQKYINDLSLGDRVFLLGKSSDIFRELSCSELFCLSSNYEGMSNALLEAACLGLPIISTDVSGVREVISNGKSGFIIPVGATDKMAECMMKLLDNFELRNSFSIEVKKKVEDFRIDKIVSQWETLILEVLQKK